MKSSEKSTLLAKASVVGGWASASEAAFSADTAAFALLAGLGLEFTSVLTELEALRDADPDCWILGKLWTYRLQDKPFVHMDNDVFLWQPLPTKSGIAPLTFDAKNIDRIEGAYRSSWYYHSCILATAIISSEPYAHSHPDTERQQLERDRDLYPPQK